MGVGFRVFKAAGLQCLGGPDASHRLRGLAAMHLRRQSGSLNGS